MRNFVQPGRTITLPAPYNVAGGDGMLVGSFFAIAASAALQGDPVEGDLCGVYDLPKADSQAWTVGAKVYWDATAKVCTTSAASGANTLIGAATQAVAGVAGLTTGRVRLNGTVS